VPGGAIGRIFVLRTLSEADKKAPASSPRLRVLDGEHDSTLPYHVFIYRRKMSWGTSTSYRRQKRDPGLSAGAQSWTCSNESRHALAGNRVTSMQD
jgi:hypothetical protein